jgi:serine/threonine protein kinase
MIWNDLAGHVWRAVLGASGLTYKQGLSDTTCKIRVEGQKFRTRVAKRTSTPVWGEEFTFFITQPAGAVAVQVHQKEMIGRTLLGELVVPIQNCINGVDEYADKWFDLQLPTNLSGAQRLTEPKVRLGFAYTKGGKPTISLRDFEILAVVGRGAFGKVYQVRKKDSGKIYAMKTMVKQDIVDKGIMEYSRAELKVLQQVRHPFMNGLIFSFHSEDKVFLVTEYLSGGDLFFHLNEQGRFSQEQTTFYMAELVLAFEHLHGLNIVYRDLKPENILLDRKGHVCLTDFGFAKKDISSDSTTYTICGTPDYMAPEMLLKKGYTLAVDWWCLGVLCYEMLTGEHPFTGNTNQEMYRKIVSQDPAFPAYLSAEALDLVRGLMRRDPDTRLGTHGGAAEVKAHPFFASIDWEKLYNRLLKPPFRPKVKGDEDVANMDPLCLRERPSELGTELTRGDLEELEGDGFEGFEYVDNDWLRNELMDKLMK